MSAKIASTRSKEAAATVICIHSEEKLNTRNKRTAEQKALRNNNELDRNRDDSQGTMLVQKEENAKLAIQNYAHDAFAVEDKTRSHDSQFRSPH